MVTGADNYEVYTTYGTSWNTLLMDMDFDNGTYKLKWGSNAWSQTFNMDFGSGDPIGTPTQLRLHHSPRAYDTDFDYIEISRSGGNSIDMIDDDIVNFRDFTEFANGWLTEMLWP